MKGKKADTRNVVNEKLGKRRRRRGAREGVVEMRGRADTFASKEERQERQRDGDGKRNGACVGGVPGAKSQVAKRHVMSTDLQFHYRLPSYG